jgi:cell shape-determining protein MreD
MEFIHKKKAEKARTKMLKYVLGFDKRSWSEYSNTLLTTIIMPKIFLCFVVIKQRQGDRR